MSLPIKVAILGFFTPSCLEDLVPSLRQPGPAMPPGTGGTAVVNLVRCRLAQGLPTDVITCDPLAAQEICRWESDILRLWVVRRRPHRAVRDAYRIERRLIHQALSESRAEVCHAHWTYEFALAGLTQAAMPCVVTVHDNAARILRFVGLPYLGQYLITRRVLSRARLLTAVSPYIAGVLSRRRKDPVPVIPNTFCSWINDARAARGREAPAGPPTIVSTLDGGRLKNLKRALRAFQMVRAQVPDVTYKLIGKNLHADSPSAQWAKANGLDAGVEFAGLRSYRDTLQEIARAGSRSRLAAPWPRQCSSAFPQSAPARQAASGGFWTKGAPAR